MTREAKKSLNCVCPAGRERSYGGIFVLGGEREGKTKRQMSEVLLFFDIHKTLVAKNAFFIRFREQGRGTRGWIVRERGLEEVNANRNIEGRG